MVLPFSHITGGDEIFAKGCAGVCSAEARKQMPWKDIEVSAFIASIWLTKYRKQCKVLCLCFFPLLEIIPQDKIVIYNIFFPKKMAISSNCNQYFAKELPRKGAEPKGMDLISFIDIWPG